MTDKKYLTEDEMLEYLEKIGIKKSRSWASTHDLNEEALSSLSSAAMFVQR